MITPIRLRRSHVFINSLIAQLSAVENPSVLKSLNASSGHRTFAQQRLHFFQHLSEFNKEIEVINQKFHSDVLLAANAKIETKS